MNRSIAKTVLFYSLMIVFTYVIQTTFLKSIAIRGVSPNLFIIVVVSIGLLRGRTEGAIIGAIIGMLCDLFYGGVFGFYSVIYMNMGFFSGYFYNFVYKDNIVLPMILIGASDVLYNYIVFFFTFAFRGKLNMTSYINQIFFTELVYTLIVGFLIYRMFYIVLIAAKLERREFEDIG